MQQTSPTTMWRIAALLFVISALVWFASGKGSLGVLFVVVAAMFCGLSLTTGRKTGR